MTTVDGRREGADMARMLQQRKTPPNALDEEMLSDLSGSDDLRKVDP